MGIRRLLTVAAALAVVSASINIAPAAAGDYVPLPGGGAAKVTAAGCTVVVETKNISSDPVTLKTFTKPDSSSKTYTDSFTGLYPLLVATVPQGVSATTTVQASRFGKVVWTTSVRNTCNVNVYTTVGNHVVNGRSWRTTCEPYSRTTRCRSEIWATKVTRSGSTYVRANGWVFNNLTYLPSPRSLWKGNPLGNPGEWTASNGSKWYTECDNDTTGKNGCRSYVYTYVILTEQVNGGFRYMGRDMWMFNNIVMFS